jgi:transposase
MTPIEQLPDDPRILKRWIVEREQHLRIEHERQLAQREQEFQTLIGRIKDEAQRQLDAERQRMEAKHRAVVLAILRRYYGPRSERFDPRQLLLFGQVIDQTPLDRKEIERESGQPLTDRRIRNRHPHGRGELPEHLARVVIEHELPDAERPCPCCGELRQRIGEEISEQLEYVPACLQVLRHVRGKYACPKCEHEGYNPNIAAAPLPPQPIDKGLAGPGLLAYVVVSKLGDHLPLYRLEKIFSRQQVHIARSTMCAWMQAAGELVRPLVELMKARVKQSRTIHTDDTTVPIQAPGERKCRQGRIWTYLGDSDHPYTVYEYTPKRTRDGPANWLSGWKGFLQADAYGGYDGVYAQGEATEVACWAHARRKFFEAKETDLERATSALTWIRELYAVEEKARELDDDARLELRRQLSLPLLARIKSWLDTEVQIVLPRSEMGKAIAYALNQWEALCVYARQGFLAIDNNASERALKRVAVGRKNWMFAGHDQSAQYHAILWSLIASAERHGIDPQRYLRSVLAKLPFTPADELDQFLPDVWRRDDLADPPPRANS